MKLIPNFYELLQKDELPTRYSDWWILEDKDFYFNNDYYQDKGIYPFTWDSPKHGKVFSGSDLFFFLKSARKVLGFFRKKNTKKDLADQKILMEQFDFDLVCETQNLSRHLRDLKDAQEQIDEWKSIYKDGMNGKDFDIAQRKRWDEQSEED